MASPQMLINQLSPMSQSSSTNTTTSSSSASSLSSSVNLDQRKAPNSARSASRLSSSFRRRNPVTGEGCISKDMMIWGGGVGAKKLIGCRSNEEIVVTEGYQRPRKIVQLQRGIVLSFIESGRVGECAHFPSYYRSLIMIL